MKLKGKKKKKKKETKKNFLMFNTKIPLLHVKVFFILLYNFAVTFISSFAEAKQY